MKLFKSADLLHLEITKLSKKGVSIGFVPTMGALHAGHLSLIERSKSENDSTVVSIFVNPKQFNETDDLVAYPRTIERDMDMLIQAQVDYLFYPEVDEIYHVDFEDVDIALNGLDLVLEGKQRPGHFQGVAKVVRRFFEIVVPHRAYFGQKDFQQTVVVRKLIRDHFPTIKLVVCPILRESHGLALSSRNERLTADGRLHASFIYKALLKLKERCHFKSLHASMLSTAKYLNSIQNAELEYLSAVDGFTMREVIDLDDADYIVAVVVVKYGGVRLLDNIVLKSKS